MRAFVPGNGKFTLTRKLSPARRSKPMPQLIFFSQICLPPTKKRLFACSEPVAALFPSRARTGRRTTGNCWAYRDRVVKHLSRKAKELGYQLLPTNTRTAPEAVA